MGKTPHDPCHFCQTSVSPAWRSAYEGGPRVYCNACAMRFRSTGSFEYRNKSSGRKPSGSPTKSARRQSLMMDEFAPSTPNRKSFDYSRTMIAMDSPPRHRVRTVRRGMQEDPEWILPGALRVPPPPPLSAFGGYQDESMSPLGPVPPLFGWTGPSTPVRTGSPPSSLGLKRRAGSDLAESFMLDFYHPGVLTKQPRSIPRAPSLPRSTSSASEDTNEGCTPRMPAVASHLLTTWASINFRTRRKQTCPRPAPSV